MVNTPLSFAIVGPGRMGSLYARLIHELESARLVAVCGRSEESTARLAGQYGVAGYAGGDYGTLLQNHPEIDAVIVAASEWAHTEPVLAALDAGKHVLVEKPMAPTVTDAERMVAAAAQAGVQLMVCHSLRFDPAYGAVRQAVAAGEIGRVLNLYARRNAPQEAAQRVLGRVPLAYWLAPHDIDMMLWTVDSPVVQVRAFTGAAGAGPHDFIIAVLTFANGVVGVLENSWGTPAHSGRAHSTFFSVRGVQGEAEVMPTENGVAVYRVGNAPYYPDTGYTPVVQGRQEGMFRHLLHHFAGVLRNEWTPAVTGTDGLAAIRVAAAIEHSIQTGHTVELPV